jgi:hypothetical protein
MSDSIDIDALLQERERQNAQTSQAPEVPSREGVPFLPMLSGRLMWPPSRLERLFCALLSNPNRESVARCLALAIAAEELLAAEEDRRTVERGPA